MTITFSRTCDSLDERPNSITGRPDTSCSDEVEVIKEMFKRTLPDSTCKTSTEDEKVCHASEHRVGPRSVCDSTRTLTITKCSGEQTFAPKEDDVRVEFMPRCFQEDSKSLGDETCRGDIAGFFSERVSKWKDAICTIRIEKQNDDDNSGKWNIMCTENPIAAAERLFGVKERVDNEQDTNESSATKELNDFLQFYRLDRNEKGGYKLIPPSPSNQDSPK